MELKCPSCDELMLSIEGDFMCNNASCGHREQRTMFTTEILPGQTVARVIGGRQSLSLKSLMTVDRRILERDLVVQSRPYRDNEPLRVECFEEEGDFLHIPRHYKIPFTIAGATIDETTFGEPYDFDMKIQLMEERGQPKAVDFMVGYLRKHGAGVLEAYTGFGKTIVGLSIAAALKRKFLVLVHMDHMIERWAEEAELVLGLTRDQIGIVQGPKYDLGKPMTIAMCQSIYTGSEVKYPDEFYNKQFGLVILDEVHRYGAPCWGTVVSKFNAKYRLSLSATPNREDGLDNVVFWNCGPIAYTAHKTEEGAKPVGVQVLYKTEYNPKSYFKWKMNAEVGKWEMAYADPVKYRKVLMKDEGRNTMIVAEMVNAAKQGRKAIVFAHLQNHIKKLRDMFDQAVKTDVEVPELTTSLFMGTIKDRELAKEMMAADWIFTTYEKSKAALNAPHIDTAFFATPPGKKPDQPVGRLRDLGPDKKELLFVDFFESNEYSMDLAKKRRKAYNRLAKKIVMLSRDEVSI